MSLKPKTKKKKDNGIKVSKGQDTLVLLRDPKTGEYYLCNGCGRSLIVEGKKKMRNWGWCPICRYPRNKSEVTKVKSGRYWNIDTSTWEEHG